MTISSNLLKSQYIQAALGGWVDEYVGAENITDLRLTSFEVGASVSYLGKTLKIYLAEDGLCMTYTDSDGYLYPVEMIDRDLRMEEYDIYDISLQVIGSNVTEIEAHYGVEVK